MANKLYIHIGRQKTATTSLQIFLEKNRKRLLNKYGIHLSCIGKKDNYLSCANHDLGWALNKQESEGKLKEYHDTLRSEVESNPKTLISSESLGPFPRELKEFLDPIDADIYIIVYLRRQDTYLQSIYHTIVCHNSFTGTFENFLDKKNVINYYSYLRLDEDYFTFLKKWSRIFGKEKIIVRPFERKQLYKEDIFSDFLKILGVENIENFKVQKPVNVSFGREMLAFIRQMNILFKKNSINFKLPKTSSLHELENILAFPKSNLISPIKSMGILNEHRESNSKIAREFLGRKDGLLFLDKEPDVNDPYNENFFTEDVFISIASEFFRIYQDEMLQIGNVRFLKKTDLNLVDENKKLRMENIILRRKLQSSKNINEFKKIIRKIIHCIKK
ncbi:MAG: hypothetical protein JW866_04995 [Ignavibacteriales bacterium]|nr:hypothetical protein [Ignavibacteriales bacterium]